MNSDALNMDRFKVVEKYRGSERGELLKHFRSHLNMQRCTDGYADLSYPRLAMIVAHIETDDLNAFYKDCTTAKCGFSRAFWGRLKVM